MSQKVVFSVGPMASRGIEKLPRIRRPVLPPVGLRDQIWRPKCFSRLGHPTKKANVTLRIKTVTTTKNKNKNSNAVSKKDWLTLGYARTPAFFPFAIH
jgi:hypothetical protein